MTKKKQKPVVRKKRQYALEKEKLTRPLPIPFRGTKIEKDEIDRRAKASGLSVQDFLLCRALDYAPQLFGGNHQDFPMFGTEKSKPQPKAEATQPTA